ncbi:Diuretic hormone 44 receptor GPRdih2 [Paragonimus heterotremus]|uniref:Diuretic hormone 44 receptor GPRdih2 n=1 Tax=Paragonimus heterotremus TaxID=100268 RepID=A0A8J4TCM5_9TREM|nr:Diuretic hormone 44 receptor GPRdih2 [Paragonimus heterotremus]
MFVEGIYLILVVYCTFQAEKLRFWIYALIGWGIPCLLTISRIVFDCVYNPRKSWILEGYDIYFVTIPTLIMLGVNVLFLVAILYALNEKLRHGLALRRPTHDSPNIDEQNAVEVTSEPVLHPSGRGSCPLSLAISVSSGRLFLYFRKTVKAGLTLMPLLGLPEVIFITPYHPTLKPAFELINAFFTSTQGFWVSLLYCFLTIEVKREFKKRQRTRSMRLSLRSSRRLT